MRSWCDIAAHYRDLIADGWKLDGMLRLVEQIEGSRYAVGIFGETSVTSLWISQTPSGSFPYGPRLEIVALYNGTFEFRYVDSMVSARQWHRVVREQAAFDRLERFFEQLHWFTKIKPPSSPGS